MCLESMVSRHRKEQKKSTYISCMLANVKNPHLYAEMSPYGSKIASVKAAYETLDSFCVLQFYVARCRCSEGMSLHCRFENLDKSLRGLLE